MRVVEFPLHIATVGEFTARVGVITLTITVLVFTHPAELVPVTVYVVVIVGPIPGLAQTEQVKAVFGVQV